MPPCHFFTQDLAPSNDIKLFMQLDKMPISISSLEMYHFYLRARVAAIQYFRKLDRAGHRHQKLPLDIYIHTLYCLMKVSLMAIFIILISRHRAEELCLDRPWLLALVLPLCLLPNIDI